MVDKAVVAVVTAVVEEAKTVVGQVRLQAEVGKHSVRGSSPMVKGLGPMARSGPLAIMKIVYSGMVLSRARGTGKRGLSQQE